MPIVDLGATNVAKTAPRTNRVAATAKISFLIDEIGLDERLVVRGGYRVVHSSVHAYCWDSLRGDR